MKFVTVFILGILLCSQINCTGGECSASSTILTDEDSDCVIDDEDNCIEDYNPNQEDSDEDGFGDACDLAPDDANEVGLNFMSRSFFYNLQGLYAAKSATCPFAFFEITQNQTRLTLVAENDFSPTFSGELKSIDLSGSLSLVTGDFQNQDQTCQLNYFPKTANFNLNCFEKNTQSSCEMQGMRTLTITD